MLGLVTSPVEAAAPSVSVCFGYGTGAPYSKLPVLLYRYNGSKYAPYKDGKTNESGCAIFRDVNTNSDYLIYAYNVTPNCGASYISCILYAKTDPLHVGYSSVDFSPGSTYWVVVSYSI